MRTHHKNVMRQALVHRDHMVTAAVGALYGRAVHWSLTTDQQPAFDANIRKIGNSRALVAEYSSRSPKVN